jgi:anti-sigma regulatory factor (Ser/Thr protein kinase)
MQDDTHSFDRRYEAAPESVARMRADVAVFAAAQGLESTLVEDVRLAVSEAATNAVMHGYRGASGTVHVAAEIIDGALGISIRDFGRGMHSRPIATGRSGMGLGLALIGRLASDVSVAPEQHGGTDVRMRFDLIPVGVADTRHALAA